MSDSETDASDVFDDYQCEDNYEDFVVKDAANNTNKNELTVYDHYHFWWDLTLFPFLSCWTFILPFKSLSLD